MKLTRLNIKRKLSRDYIAQAMREVRNDKFSHLHDPLFEQLPEMRKEHAPITGLWFCWTPSRHLFIQRKVSLRYLVIEVIEDKVYFNRTSEHL